MTLLLPALGVLYLAARVLEASSLTALETAVDLAIIRDAEAARARAWEAAPVVEAPLVEKPRRRPLSKADMPRLWASFDANAIH